MRQVTFIGRIPVPRSMQVGVELDNNVEQVKFVLPEIVDGQSASLYWQIDEHGDVVLLDDGIWNIDHTITQYPGQMTAYIAISNTDATILWHSETFNVFVYDLPSTEDVIEQEYPTAIQTAVNAAAAAVAANESAQTAVQTTTADADRAETAATNAEASETHVAEMAETVSEQSTAATNAATNAATSAEQATKAAEDAQDTLEKVQEISFSINGNMEMEVELGWQQ